MPGSLYLNEVVSESEKKDTWNEIKGAIRFIASLSCVDGLIILNKDLKVKGFGAIIKTHSLPDFIYTSPTSVITNGKLKEVNPDHYGTRHRSMFSYCWNNVGSLGFVVSQDGDIRAITRVGDQLIMWENIKVQQFINSRKLRRLPPKKK